MRTVIQTIAFVALVLIVTFSFHILLIGFAGLLLAIFLRTAADWVRQYTKLPYRWSLAVVVVVLIGMLTLNIWLFGRSFASQIDEMREGIVRASGQIYEYSQKYGWTQRLLPRATQEGQGAVLSGARTAVSGTLSVIAGLILMLFIALYVSS